MKKRILVVKGHPAAGTFNSEIFKTYVKAIRPENCDVETLDLGKMKFDPVLRYGYHKLMPPDAEIEKSQRLVQWSDKIVFIYPIWWASMPSLLKGWLDRVLTPGFAYNHANLGMQGHLAPRTAELWLTCDAPSFYFKILNRTPVKLMKNDILKSCGIRTTRVEIFGNSRASTPQQRENWLGKVRAAAGLA
ncbi:MAG: NAD(P)H-dependent oxidoreductase [Candidatus Nomurabacteria bacterium]|jgi:putative NADPH-quinone reductase|nr:NAD(P)H-dependent oxidoreductase [Candidatus Nomurabacteria bacterium]